MVDLIETTPTLDVSGYRDALGSFLTGVTVITAVDGEGKSRGLTANSFTSVSLDPPLVLFCVDKRASSHDVFAEGRGFAVHIMGSDQMDVAKAFASKAADKFEGIPFHVRPSGVPMLDDAHAVLECSAEQFIDAGDHAVVIGRVEAFGTTERRPLGFYRGKLQTFFAESEVVSLAETAHATIAVHWVLETVDGLIALTRTPIGHQLPESDIAAEALDAGTLSTHASKLFGAPVVIDFLYSVYGAGDGVTLVYRGRFTSDAAVPDVDFVPAAVATGRVADPAERAVLDRYVSEREGASFGIYAGSMDMGDTASISGRPTRDHVDVRKIMS